jgi:hypothetical protein
LAPKHAREHDHGCPPPEALAAGASNRARFVVSRLTSQAQLFDYIEVLHKQERMHSAIGYAALAEFERAAG